MSFSGPAGVVGIALNQPYLTTFSLLCGGCDSC